MVFIKPDCLVVFDRGQTAAGIERIWQLNTPIKPTTAVGGKGPITLADKTKLTLVPLDESASARLVDWSAIDSKEYHGGWRVELADRGPSEFYSMLNVIYLDDAADSVEPVADGTQRGTQIKLKDGRLVKILFSTTGPIGGSIKIKRNGKNVFDGTLSGEVPELPLFNQ